MLLDQQIERLEQLRIRLAALSQVLAERELEARVLRLTIETELRQDGRAGSITEAEKLARADERYLRHSRETIQRTYDRAVVEAEAEAARLAIELQLAAVRREAIGA